MMRDLYSRKIIDSDRIKENIIIKNGLDAEIPGIAPPAKAVFSIS
jgi:hypothetical protein